MQYIHAHAGKGPEAFDALKVHQAEGRFSLLPYFPLPEIVASESGAPQPLEKLDTYRSQILELAGNGEVLSIETGSGHSGDTFKKIVIKGKKHSTGRLSRIAAAWKEDAVLPCRLVIDTRALKKNNAVGMFGDDRAGGLVIVSPDVAAAASTKPRSLVAKTLRHEAKHRYFSKLRRSGVATPFDGDISSTLQGNYVDFAKAEELFCFWGDTQFALLRLLLGDQDSSAAYVTLRNACAFGERISARLFDATGAIEQYAEKNHHVPYVIDRPEGVPCALFSFSERCKDGSEGYTNLSIPLCFGFESRSRSVYSEDAVMRAVRNARKFYGRYRESFSCFPAGVLNECHAKKTFLVPNEEDEKRKYRSWLGELYGERYYRNTSDFI